MIPQVVIPKVVIWAAGAIGAFALARVIRWQYRRVNEELDAARLSPIESGAERNEHPTLKRDPRTGVYRP